MSNVISLYRGDDRTISLIVKKPDGTAYNVTGCTIKLYIKRQIEDINAEAIITKTGTITSGVDGTAEFVLIPADTNDATELENNVAYPYDVELTTPEGKQYTVLRASFVMIHK